MLQANDWEGLLAFLGDLKPELARDMDELKMAWQVCRLPHGHGICYARTILNASVDGYGAPPFPFRAPAPLCTLPLYTYYGRST